MATQLWPDTWYMMKALRSGLNSRCLSPSNARLAVVSSASRDQFDGARQIGLARRRLGRRGAGRSTRHRPYAAAITAASNEARRLRGADA